MPIPEDKDPRLVHLRFVTAHGNHYVDVPAMTEIAPNLWHGGAMDRRDLILPNFIQHVVSLYPLNWRIGHPLRSKVFVDMDDTVDQEFEQVDLLSQWVNLSRETGPVFVHCQAGLNRSGLIVAKALVLNGDVENGDEAIRLMRAKRDLAVLCNPAFETHVKTFGVSDLTNDNQRV